MRRLVSDVALFVLLPLWLLVCAAQAQFNTFPRGMFVGRGALDAAGGVSFSGPGDVVSGAMAWWGLRAYSAAKAGTKAVRLVRASDSTQQDINSLATGLPDAASASTFCNATTCKVVTLYDQSGGTLDVTQGTDANRPAFTFNCIGTLPCITWNSTSILQSAGNIAAQAIPVTFSYVAKRTSTTTTNTVISTNTTTIQVGFDAANTVFLFNGSNVPNVAATDNVLHAVQSVINNASSVLYVDGSSNAVNSGAATGITASLAVVGGSAINPFTGVSAEHGIWPIGFSGTQNSNMNSNQHGSNGWNF